MNARRMGRSLLFVAACFPSFLAPAFSATTARVLLLDAAKIESSAAIVAVGERGTILRSTDAGATWSAITAPPDARATLTGVTFAPNSPHGWAVGHDALILSSSDAGQTWQKQYQGDDLESSFLDVLALDAQRIIAIGAYGLCFATSDGGRTWSPRTVTEDDAHLNRLSLSPDGTLFIAGERGTLLRSRDSGETWSALDAPYDGSFYGVLPLSDGSLLAYGLRGHVFRSSDGGDTWQPIPLERPTLVATAAQTSADTIVLAGQSRGLYVSHNRGHTFHPWSDEFLPAIAELLPAPDSSLLAFGESGVTPLKVEQVVPNALLAPHPPPNPAR